MKSRWPIFVVGLGLLFGCTGTARAKDQLRAKPNVLFIAIDDLRDWVGYLGKNPQTKTPNIDRLAARGLSFTASYCAAPVCNASRAALLSGLRPSTSGVYENHIDWRKAVPDSAVTLPLYFKQQGYHCAGAGKIYHEAYRRDSDWTEYLNRDSYDPNDPEDVAPRSAKKKSKETREVHDIGGIAFGPVPGDDADMEDYQTVSYCLKRLERRYDQPLFLACGLKKPHMPWSVPKKYYEMFPLDSIVLPKVLENDLDDVPAAGRRMARPEGDHAAVLASGRWKEAVQAYLATIAFCDAMVGRLLDGFDKSAYRDNTLIVLWSDHGWHLGEKQHWRKFALWEEATRSPLIWVVPGRTTPGSVCHRTVDFMHIYPTLCDLCGLAVPKHIQGQSIAPLLKDPTLPLPAPAVMTYHYQNHAVRSEAWRLIRYADGSEELYDEKNDPFEWTNLAGKPDLEPIKSELRQSLPRDNAPEEPMKRADKNKQAKKQEKKRAK